MSEDYRYEREPAMTYRYRHHSGSLIHCDTENDARMYAGGWAGNGSGYVDKHTELDATIIIR